MKAAIDAGKKNVPKQNSSQTHKQEMAMDGGWSAPQTPEQVTSRVPVHTAVPSLMWDHTFM